MKLAPKDVDNVQLHVRASASGSQWTSMIDAKSECAIIASRCLNQLKFEG